MKLLTVKELSKAINIKSSTIYAWAGRGRIPSHKLNGLLRFDFDEVTVWINDSKVVAIPPRIPRKKTISNGNLEKIIKNSIASVKEQGYNLVKQRENQTFSDPKERR